MPTRYEWVSTGTTAALPAPGASLVFTMAPTLGKALKRVQTRGLLIRGSNSGLTSGVVEPLEIWWSLYWPTGSTDDTYLIHRESHTIPHTVTAFFADAVDLYNIWWHGSDQECGFNEAILRGKVSDLEGGPVTAQMTVWSPGTFNYEDHVGIDVEVRALFSYLG